MPELAGDAGSLAEELGREMAAMLSGATEEVENAGNSAGAIKGWATRRRNGWQAKPRDRAKAVSDLVDDALDNPDPAERIAIYGQLNALEASLLGLPPGYERGMSRHAVRHIMRSHGNPATEEPRGQIAVTREDIKRIPEIIAKSQEAHHFGTKGKNVESIRYYFDDPTGGTTTVLDEVRTKRKRLIPVNLMKFKKAGHRLPAPETK